MNTLLDKQAVLDYFGGPKPSDLERWCWENNFQYVAPTRDEPGDGPSDLLLAAALWYARTRYPQAANIDVCSFAGLVSYLATGWYGGFGTESYPREQSAQHIILTLAGAVGGDGTYFMPVRSGAGPRFTRLALRFLETFYFVDEERALLQLIEASEDRVTARLILGLTQVEDKYRAIADIANRFLRKKAPASELRAAVRRVLPRVAPQATAPRTRGGSKP